MEMWTQGSVSDLSSSSSSSSAAVAEAEAIPALVAVLINGSSSSSGSEALQPKAAARALSHLAMTVENHAAMVQAGCVPALLAQLDSQHTFGTLQEAAVQALNNLACSDTGREALAQGGAIPALLRVLNSYKVVCSFRQASEAARLALLNLACTGIRVPDTLQELIQQLPDATAEQAQQLLLDCANHMRTDPQLNGWWIEPEELVHQQQLDRGSFGDVHKHDWRGSPVVVKQFRLAENGSFGATKPANGALAKSFVVEVLGLAQLALARHPNIVQMCGFTQHQGVVGIVLEYIEHGTLRTVVKKWQELSSTAGLCDRWDLTTDGLASMGFQAWVVPSLLLWRWAVEVANALQCAHSQTPPIVHRDIKHINILIVSSGNAKLIDFGISKQLTQPGFMPLTCNQGTFNWAPPEMLQGSYTCTEKVDVYSFGVLLWYLLTKEEPFAKEITRAYHDSLVLKGIAEGELRLSVPKGAHPHLVQLITACFSFNPKDRPCMADVVAALQDMGHAAFESC